MSDYLLLKWGSLKGWKVSSPQDKALLKKWIDLGVSYSAALHQDTAEQKDILIKLIEGFNGAISNDWSGEEYTKDQAIRYIKEYGQQMKSNSEVQ